MKVYQSRLSSLAPATLSTKLSSANQSKLRQVDAEDDGEGEKAKAEKGERKEASRSSSVSLSTARPTFVETATKTTSFMLSSHHHQSSLSLSPVNIPPIIMNLRPSSSTQLIHYSPQTNALELWANNWKSLLQMCYLCEHGSGRQPSAQSNLATDEIHHVACPLPSSPTPSWTMATFSEYEQGAPRWQGFSSRHMECHSNQHVSVHDVLSSLTGDQSGARNAAYTPIYLLMLQQWLPLIKVSSCLLLFFIPQ